MGVFSKLENMMQGAVEGPFNRLFRTHLEPVELANKLTRAMEAHLQIGHERKLAPNVYEVSLSKRDYARFNAYAQSLAQQLSQALIEVARDRGYTLTSKPVIQFIESGSVGTGQARGFGELMHAVFSALGRVPNIEFIDMPQAIRNSYQYFTQASVENLRRAGYNTGFTPLEEAVKRYVTGFLDQPDRYR